MINPFTVILSFALVLLLLALFKPQAGRIVFGIFFLVMAWGVNFPLLLLDPALFAAAGAHAYIPFYRWFFTVVLAWNPVPFVVLLILFETGVGISILSRGRLAKIGLGLGALFCLLIAWIGVEGLMVPAMALAPAILMRKTFSESILDLGMSFLRSHRRLSVQ